MREESTFAESSFGKGTPMRRLPVMPAATAATATPYELRPWAGDDVRNFFTLTSALERQNMDVLSAETGKDAISKLQSTEGIDILLMDIVMPDLDGYDTCGRFHDLPIAAVTAKAMKGDREKTLQAWAWDYLSKPVDTGRMLSVRRNWLFR